MTRERHVRAHAKQASTHDLFTKSCLRPTETFAGGGGQKAEGFQQPTTGGPGTDCRSQNSTRGAKFKKPKFKKRAHRKQHCSRPHMPGKGRPALPGGLANCPRQTRLPGPHRARKRPSNLIRPVWTSPSFSPGLWNLEQLVPSTPNPLLPENAAVLVEQLARA